MNLNIFPPILSGSSAVYKAPPHGRMTSSNGKQWILGAEKIHHNLDNMPISSRDRLAVFISRPILLFHMHGESYSQKDQALVEPKIRSSLQLFILNLS